MVSSRLKNSIMPVRLYYKQAVYRKRRRDLREILARNKDVLTCVLKPKPTYLGEAIPVSGNGDLTNDKK